MSLTKGQLMTHYKNTRNELGTIRYSRLVKPNILDDYTLYLKDLTEMEELEHKKTELLDVQQSKNIDLSKKTTLFDLLDISHSIKSDDSNKKSDKDESKKSEKDESDKDSDKDESKKSVKDESKKSDKDESNKSDKDSDKDESKKSDKDESKKSEDASVDSKNIAGKKKLKITVSTEPDKKSNKLIL